MIAIPLTIKQANRLVDRFHRHAEPVQGGKFAIGVKRGSLCTAPAGLFADGAAICGRPAARSLDRGTILQISRVAVSDDLKNGCSFLLGRCCRVAKAMGYRYIITYTLASEPGTSLLAAGFYLNAISKSDGQWDRPDRIAPPPLNTEVKLRWARDLR